MKKYIYIIVIAFVLVLGIILIKSNLNKSNNIPYGFIISTNNNIKKNNYIGTYENYSYYLKDNDVSEIYIVSSNNYNNLNNKIIKNAKVSLKNNNYSFTYENNTYNIVPLFDALYLQDNMVSISFEDLYKYFNKYIIKKENKYDIDLIIKSTNENEFKEVYSSLNNDKIFVKNIGLTINSINGKKPDEYNNIPSAIIINEIVNGKSLLYNVEDISDDEIDINAYEYDKLNYLIVKRIVNDYKFNYYVYTQNIKEFCKEYGF